MSAPETAFGGMHAGRKILYVDPYDVPGHRAEHLAFYLRACAGVGIELLCCVPTRLWEQAVERSGAAASGRQILDLEIPYPGTLAEQKHVLEMAAKTVKETGSGLIYFPMLDFFWKAMATRRFSGRGMCAPWSGVVFGDDFNFLKEEFLRPKRFVLSLLRMLLLRYILKFEAKEIFTLNSSWKASMPVPVTWLPDAFSQAAIEHKLKSDESAPWPVPRAESEGGRIRFLMVGAMEPRKGLLEVTEAFLALDDSELSNVEFRALGRFVGDAAYRVRAENLFRELARRGATVELRATYISDQDLDSALCRCDYILAPYIFHIGSSGVVGLAAQYGRPLLSQDVYQMGTDVRKYQLGLAVNTRKKASLVAALRKMINREVGATPGMWRFWEERMPTRALTVVRDVFARIAS